MKKFSLFLSFICLFCACNSDQPPIKEEQLPNTPESVVRAWQGYVDVNQFDKAKRLSTKETKSFLATLTGEEEIISTQFVSIRCKNSSPNDAICNCILKEGDEEYTDQFLLKKENGQWLVFSPDDANVGPDLEDLEDMMKDFEEQLNEKLETQE